MDKSKLKSFFSMFIGKLLVFLFCVFFVSMHNKIFGIDNSIVAVIILMGILIFIKNDFGYNTKQAAIGIFVMFVIVAVAPKISLLNPFTGLIVNVVSMGLIMMLSAHYVTMGNQLPFMMGYIFCQGYDIAGRTYGMRVIRLVGFGLLIAIMYYAINHKREQKRNVIDLFKEIDIHSTRTQWYIKLVLSLSVVMFIGDLCDYPKTMWITLTVLSLTTPLIQEHQERKQCRVIAAILGTIIFFVLFEYVIPEQYQTMVVMIAGFGSMFITSYFIKTIYNSFSSLIAAVLLFPAKQAVLIRIISNIIGVVFAVAAHYLFNVVFRLTKNKDKFLVDTNAD